jgi:Uncharacterized conserved protein (DUF2075)
MPAYYTRTVEEFLSDSDTSILGSLADANTRANFLQLESAAIEAWRNEISLLRETFARVIDREPSANSWGLLLEFPIPRRQRRADLILIARDIVFVVEFKTTHADLSSIRQVEDYALDLSDFHEPSRNVVIVPIVVAPSERNPSSQYRATSQKVQPVATCTPLQLGRSLLDSFYVLTDPRLSPIDIRGWDNGAYHPVPTIIEAAQSIFAGMEVREIAHSAADAGNLLVTVDALFNTMREARELRRKTICFVTGVPGSGKTLAGLRAVHDPRNTNELGTDPTFLSGNGPLVKILREALTHDFALREKSSRHSVRRKVETLIQNVHAFAKNYWDDYPADTPHEQIIVFDEAQRAWNADRNRRKFGRCVSEPSMILKIMDRHTEWAVIVALVGSGQEIHDGEAGLAEWGRTLSTEFRHWSVVAASEALNGGASLSGSTLFGPRDVAGLVIHQNESLHLSVSTRSYKAVTITEWSNAFLEGNLAEAANVLSRTTDFPVVVTRNLARAKSWLHNQTRGTARCGLVGSSGAARLRAEGLETSTAFHRDYPYEYWFLKEREDIRSSNQLEVLATEFEIQGLELDWVGLCWGGDLIWDESSSEWKFRKFSGTKWRNVKKDEQKTFLTNSYRVLLTRARQGMVIWIPPGESLDYTRVPKEFDATEKAIIDSGIKTIDS